MSETRLQLKYKGFKMNKLELIKITKELTGTTNIHDLIKETKYLYDYLNDDIDFAVRATELKVFKEFISDILLDCPINGLKAKPVTYKKGYDKIIKAFENNNRITYNNKRQDGTTTFLCLYSLYIAITNPNSAILLCSIKEWYFNIMRDLIMDFYSQVDQYFKPAIINCNKKNIVFDNGSRIIFRSISENMSRGLTITHLFMDMAGYVPYTKSKQILSGIVPSISQRKMLVCSDTTDENPDNFFNMCKIGADVNLTA